jgi:hypothetical protein
MQCSSSAARKRMCYSALLCTNAAILFLGLIPEDRRLRDRVWEAVERWVKVQWR